MYEEEIDEQESEAGVKEVINRFKNTFESNRELIQENDWVWGDDMESMFELEAVIMDTMIKNATELYNLVRTKRKDDAKIAYKWLAEHKSLFKIFEVKCEAFFREGVSAVKKKVLGEGEKGKAAELAEITKLKKFENRVTTLYAKGKSQMDLIKVEGADQDEINLKLRANTPTIPYSMRKTMESKYPAIAKQLNKRREEYHVKLKKKK